MKKILIGLLIIIVLLVIITSIYLSKKNDSDSGDLEIVHLTASYSIDVNDIKQLIGSADYVFVAKVDEEIDVLYKDKVVVETKKGPKVIGDPYTKYSIEVIDNIKGNLKKGEDINILKAGGISEDRRAIWIYENDELLKENNYYIMSAYAQPDGSILVVGANSSIHLNGKSREEIMKISEYRNFKWAFENQKIENRKRFKSVYEEK